MKFLHGKKIGLYTTHLQFLPRRRVGHFDISLFLKDSDGKISDSPLIEGIYSKGNRTHNNQGWFDIHYTDRANFGDGNPVVLSRLGRGGEDILSRLP